MSQSMSSPTSVIPLGAEEEVTALFVWFIFVESGNGKVFVSLFSEEKLRIDRLTIVLIREMYLSF